MVVVCVEVRVGVVLVVGRSSGKSMGRDLGSREYG